MFISFYIGAILEGNIALSRKSAYRTALYRICISGKVQLGAICTALERSLILTIYVRF
jgi:hypothetical protein